MYLVARASIRPNLIPTIRSIGHVTYARLTNPLEELRLNLFARARERTHTTILPFSCTHVDDEKSELTLANGDEDAHVVL